MCEAMKTLMRDEMMEAWRKREARDEARGEMKAKKEAAFELANMNLPAEKIAKTAILIFSKPL